MTVDKLTLRFSFIEFGKHQTEKLHRYWFIRSQTKKTFSLKLDWEKNTARNVITIYLYFLRFVGASLNVL